MLGRRFPILLALAATFLVAACGPSLPGGALDDYDGGADYDYDYGDDDFGYDGNYGDDGLPSPDPFASPSPSLSPSPSPSTTAPSWNGPPNDFRRLIGKGFLSSWLYGPRGLAVSGNMIYIADANRSGLRGPYGAVMVFDGASEDSFTSYASMYYERRDGNSYTRLLNATTQAVAVNDEVVLASDATGVKGFIRAIPENALNAGNPIAPACRDMVFAGGVLYMAQPYQIAALKADTWQTTKGLDVAARGLGADPQGRLWVVTASRISAYQDGQQVMDFDARGTDGTGPTAIQLQDVAVDPRNGDLYVLDQTRVLRYDSAGKFISTFGGGRIGLGASIAVGADGHVYVSDSQEGQVYQFRPGA